MEEETTEGKEQAQVTRPSSPSEGAKMFRKEQAKKPSEGTKEGTKTEVCETCETGDVPPSQKLRIVNEKGEEVPLVYVVDGKEIKVTDIEDLKKKASFGHKGYDIFGDLTKKEQEIIRKEQEIENAIKALEPYTKARLEGKLKIVDSKEVPTEEEEEEFIDPEKEVLTLKKTTQKQAKEIEYITKLISGYIIEDQSKKLQSELESLQPKYPLVQDLDEAWNLLGQPDNVGMTPEQAMKKLQEGKEKDFKTYLEKHPEVKAMDEKKKQTIIAEYLADKTKKEEAPVGAPSVEAAGGEGEKKVKISSPEHGARLFFEKLNKTKQASETS